jgi:hypothetical protein
MQLEIPQATRPDLDMDYLTALARLSPTLAYRDIRNDQRTVREAVTIIVDAVLVTNWMALNEYFESHGKLPYLKCEFLCKEIEITEVYTAGFIAQWVDGEESLFMDCGEDFTYEPATMRKIRERVIDLFSALAVIHDRAKAKEDAENRANSDLPF